MWIGSHTRIAEKIRNKSDKGNKPKYKYMMLVKRNSNPSYHYE